MKNARIQPLIVLTCMFAALVGGLFLVRTKPPTPVQIQPIPVETSAVSEITTADIPEIININTATAAQFQTLTGIGPTLAERIIDYRDKNGAFHSIGELMMVPGIGEKKLEPIWDLLTTGG